MNDLALLVEVKNCLFTSLAQFLQTLDRMHYRGEFVDGDAVKTDGRVEGGGYQYRKTLRDVRSILLLSFNALVCACVCAFVCCVCVCGVLRYICLGTSASAHACVFV